MIADIIIAPPKKEPDELDLLDSVTHASSHNEFLNLIPAQLAEMFIINNNLLFTPKKKKWDHHKSISFLVHPFTPIDNFVIQAIVQRVLGEIPGITCFKIGNSIFKVNPQAPFEYMANIEFFAQ